MYTLWEVPEDTYTPWEVPEDIYTPWEVPEDTYTPWEVPEDTYTPWEVPEDIYTPWPPQQLYLMAAQLDRGSQASYLAPVVPETTCFTVNSA
ncbi:hypothetical protein NDU88_000272 [Pleurodeles waltl]|uniref:Uncharacterized protein n=1 Tax=Pleurodeles waltl TaxID=8319 RepID=A0AAV7V6D0_PLEWA|nr:hypothetical protein NDU88_000272 [Pleurodeles waltl]